MAGTRQGLARTFALSLICFGTLTVYTRAQPASGAVADDAVKQSQAPIGQPIERAPEPALAGAFQSAHALFREGKFAAAERQFAWIAEVRTGTTWGERSQYYLAECQYQQKNYTDALASWERLHTDYPATSYRDQIVRREYQLAQVWITWGKPVILNKKKAFVFARFHQGPPNDSTAKLALRALDAVRQTDPSGPLAADATIKIADYYMTQGDYDAAAAYYNQLLVEYPTSPFCPHARLRGVEARLRFYLLNHRDAAGLAVARGLAVGLWRALWP
jgi:TolA-binding protein